MLISYSGDSRDSPVSESITIPETLEVLTLQVKAYFWSQGNFISQIYMLGTQE